MKAVVLAAGKGVRLWPLTIGRPKPLIPVLGQPLLARTLRALAIGGITETVVVTNYQALEIKKAIGNGSSFGLEIEYLKQEKTTGTANALLAARRSLADEDTFLVVYADNYYSTEAVDRFIKIARKSEPNTLIIGAVSVQDTSQFGQLTIERNSVKAIREKSSARLPGEVIAGLYLLNTSTFRAALKTKRSSRGEYELTDALQSVITSGKQEVRAMKMARGEWQSITHPWDLLDANGLALNELEDVRNGTIESGVRLSGKLVAANGSTIKSGCYIEGPVFIDEDATVGPNSYLRPYTVIGRGAHVGANCEIKNSILMEKVKVPHLSYIGDSVLGAEVSLGAGTITANLRFDDSQVHSMIKKEWVDSGRRKLGAIIGDKARTGINVSLLPGVKVGSGAWLGPAVVVSKDVPDGARLKK